MSALFLSALLLATPAAPALPVHAAEPAPAEPRSPGDARLEGYIAAWLEHARGVPRGRIEVAVEDGVVSLEGRFGDPEEIGRIVDAVAALPGVVRVVNRLEPEYPGRMRERADAPTRKRRWASWWKWLGPAEGRRSIRFPAGDLFTPPLADQKQPRFHTTVQDYDLPFGDFNVGSVGFGENFGLLRIPHEREGDGWQLGFSGAVFAIFNLDAPSIDLLNADYYVGFPLSWRSGDWSARGRVFHLSSHLGDEFLLLPQPGPPVERINLSYEALELLGSREWGPWRLYYGGVKILHSDTPLGRDRLQTGFEWRSRRGAPLGGRWIAGLDVQAWDETDWDRDVSLKGGLRVPSPYGETRHVQFLVEWYDGHVPHGQFFNLEVEYIGLGVAFSL